MNWTWKVELVYRRFVRQGIDNQAYFEVLKHDLEAEFGERLVVSDIEEDRWPIKPKEVQATRDKGLTITNVFDEPHVTIWSLPVAIQIEEPITSFEYVMETLRRCLPTYKFAVVRKVQEALTEVHAE